MCDEKLKSIWYAGCSGKRRNCVSCGQNVCEYHGACNSKGVKGGHSDCRGFCNTTLVTKVNCSGHMNECDGCKKLYCNYHSQQVGLGCVKGGHICDVFCDTSPHYRTNCKGAIRTCSTCPYRFCEYHFPAVSSAAQLTQGHVCNTSSGGAVANFVGSASYIAVGAALTTTAVVMTGGGALAIGAAVVSGAVAGGGVKKALNRVECNTSRHTNGMCDGLSKECQYCHSKYCTYHFIAAPDLWQPTSGHCCSEFTKHAKIGNFIGGTISFSTYVADFLNPVYMGMSTTACLVAGDFQGVALNAIAFGGGYVVGRFVGIRLAGSKDLSERTIKVLGTCAGGIAGGLVRPAAHYVIVHVFERDGSVTAVQLWIDVALGMVSGGQGGFMGVKAGLIAKMSAPTATPNAAQQQQQVPPAATPVAGTCPQTDAAKQAGKPVMDALQQAQDQVQRGGTAVGKKVVVSVLTTADGQNFVASSGSPTAPFFLHVNSSAVTANASFLDMSHTSRVFGVDIRPLAVIEERVAAGAAAKFRATVNCAEARALELALQNGVTPDRIVSFSTFQRDGVASGGEWVFHAVARCKNCLVWTDILRSVKGVSFNPLFTTG